jgi:DNA-binding MarR family transcriptional regulator
MQLNEYLKITELLDILSGRLSASLNRILNKKFKEEGLEITSEQWLILLSLWNKDNVTQQAICDQTSKDKGGVTRLLDTLSKHDLIERLPSSTDRRVNLIHLTEKGKNLEKKAMEIVKQIFSQAIAGISEQELIYTHDVICKILSNLSIEPSCI